MSLSTLTSWLGAGGKPVERWQAEQRAPVCEICPKNKAPRWWEKMLHEPIAAAIREQLALKHEMNLAVPNEEDLSMCQVCGCCTRLKIWTPIEHIVSHMQPEDHYPDNCWIPQEIAR